MGPLSRDDIRRIFTSAEGFNELFDALEEAIRCRIDDVELYRLLFWNKSLRQDELVFFGERVAGEFPNLAYDIYMWLAKVLQTAFSQSDHYETAIVYFQKAAMINPNSPDPYLNACDCYEPDLNIPPVETLIELVKKGLEKAENQKSLYARLAYLYHIAGDEEQSDYYRRQAGEL